MSSEWASEQVGPDDYDVWVKVEVESEYFDCPVCHLILDGYELVEASGIVRVFSDVGDPVDFAEPDYGND